MCGLKFVQHAPGLLAFAEITAQDGVDETCLRTEAEHPGQFDGFVDGGMIGNACEPEQLIQSKAQQNLQPQFLGSARGFPGEICQRWCILPFDRMSKSIMVGTANPFNQQAAKELSEATNNRLLWYLVPPSELVSNLRKAFSVL